MAKCLQRRRQQGISVFTTHLSSRFLRYLLSKMWWLQTETRWWGSAPYISFSWSDLAPRHVGCIFHYSCDWTPFNGLDLASRNPIILTITLILPLLNLASQVQLLHATASIQSRPYGVLSSIIGDDHIASRLAFLPRRSLLILNI